jgi:hypothetical protein
MFGNVYWVWVPLVPPPVLGVVAPPLVPLLELGTSIFKVLLPVPSRTPNDRTPTTRRTAITIPTRSPRKIPIELLSAVFWTYAI